MSDPLEDHVDQSQSDPPERRPDQPEQPSARPREVRGEVVRGHRPGEQYVRVFRPFARGFQRADRGYFVAREEVLEPRGGIARVWYGIRRLLIGPRIPSAHEVHERLTNVKALAIFGSDNISSSAYATEEIMRVLVLAAASALVLTNPISLAIVCVLAIVVASYRQTIRAYPSGGGSYIVASDNLGRLPGLVAGAALLTDYVLTVSVSIAAGVAALTSIFPVLFEDRVALGVTFVVLLCLGNLRGIRESGTIFSAPTYVYLGAIFGLVAYGLVLFATGSLPAYQAPVEWLQEFGAGAPLSLLLILRAFASGSVALTGVEAVSNGVPAFKPPEWRNAQIVLTVMAILFATIFLGISVLVVQLGILPDPTEQQTVVSQLAAVLVGGGSPYHYLVQLATAVLLVLAANTAFADFPRLASILARDGYLPSQFQFRGERLAFSVGIVALATVAALLIVAFQGSVTLLIPLYTVGVFVAFTLSQSGMVKHWWRLRDDERNWRWRAIVNGLGATATFIVAVVVGVAKFALGAWMVLLLIPIFVLIMLGIHRHYATFSRELAVRPGETILPPNLPPAVVVPVSRIDRPTIAALGFARSISPDVTAVHVSLSREEAQQFRSAWEEYRPPVPLVIVDSPYRALVEPLMAYIDAVDQQDPRRPVTVVLPEFVPRHWWEYPLHNQSALRLKFRLFYRPNTIVVDVPYVPGVGFEGETRG